MELIKKRKSVGPVLKPMEERDIWSFSFEGEY
jgi:hypothetical protein